MTILSSSSTFTVGVSTVTRTISVDIIVLPAVGFPTGNGRLVHPTLGAYDYSIKPDEWVNIDGDAIIAPVWAVSRTLSGAASALWSGSIQDVVAEEHWSNPGGLQMPASQLRAMLAIWMNPVDPAVGYVQWFPNYATNIGFNVLPVDLKVGSGGGAGGAAIVLDDVVHTKDIHGGDDGWITKPVSFSLRLVSKL